MLSSPEYIMLSFTHMSCIYLLLLIGRFIKVNTIYPKKARSQWLDTLKGFLSIHLGEGKKGSETLNIVNLACSHFHMRLNVLPVSPPQSMWKSNQS